MRFQCPSCKDIITAADGQYGKKVVCPHCNAPTLTPESAFGSGMAIGDFIIIKQLGSGGAGVVYLAHQISLDRPAALKILRSTQPDATDDPIGGTYIFPRGEIEDYTIVIVGGSEPTATPSPTPTRAATRRGTATPIR